MSAIPDPAPEGRAALRGITSHGLDLLIVAGIIGVGTLAGPPGVETAAGRLLTLGLALPLLWRRRHPLAVFAVIALVALAQWFADVRAFGDTALLVALYTVASACARPVALGAAAAIELGVVLAVARWSGADWMQAFVGLTGLATAAAVLGSNVRHRRALVASLQERASRLEHERDQQGRLAAAAERSRIARELHDIVAHNLSVMVALADGASYAVHDTPERALVAMQTASRTGRQALTEMRRLLGVLREAEPGFDARAPQPGVGEVDALVEQVRSAGLPVTLTVEGRPGAGDTPAGLELAAYRIVQEALTNTLKHAGPGAEAAVTLRWRPDRLVIEASDSGRGAHAPARDGGGLRGIRERAAVYDGVVEVGPAPEGGWRVRAELVHAAPVTEAAVR